MQLHGGGVGPRSASPGYCQPEPPMPQCPTKGSGQQGERDEQALASGHSRNLRKQLCRAGATCAPAAAQLSSPDAELGRSGSRHRFLHKGLPLDPAHHMGRLSRDPVAHECADPVQQGGDAAQRRSAGHRLLAFRLESAGPAQEGGGAAGARLPVRAAVDRHRRRLGGDQQRHFSPARAASTDWARRKSRWRRTWPRASSPRVAPASPI